MMKVRMILFETMYSEVRLWIPGYGTAHQLLEEFIEQNGWWPWPDGEWYECTLSPAVEQE